MRKAIAASSADAYVVTLDGWRRKLVSSLRAAVRSAAPLEEVIKWGHLVYFANGPVLFIRAEDERVLFGYWRGKRLRDTEPRLKPGGKYDLATFDMREGDSVAPAIVRRLTKRAVSLNKAVGNPTRAAKRRRPA